MVEIKSHLGRTVMMLDGRPVNPAMYCMLAMGREEFEPVWRKAVDRFVPDGIDIYLVGVPQRWEKKFELDPFWDGDVMTTEPMHISLEQLDAGPKYVLERDPDARVMVRFSARPRGRWFDLHPDELVVREDGVREKYPSMASRFYAEEAAKYCSTYIRFCESRPWAHRCLGYVNYHLCEGTHGPLSDSWLYDYSPVMTARWREYLRGTYGTDERLCEFYGDPSLSLETIEVPRDRLRGSVAEVAEILYWQDARENRPLRDFLLLVRELYHENFRLLCTASREAAPGKLMLHDTFKLPMQGWSNHGFFSLEKSWPNIYTENLAGSGNMDVLPLLDIPGNDGICTPYDYQVRGAGGIFEPEGIADSTALREKVFFVEQDIRTYAGNVHNCGMMRDLQEFTAVTWRDLATALTRGFMNYMTDHNADYYSDPPMHDVVKRQVEVLHDSVKWPHRTVPGIAMILDEQCALETNGAGQVLNEAVMWEQKIGISRCGVPYRIYLLDDLRHADFSEHRVYYFPNLYRVDDDRLQLLREKVFRNGHVVVWGPGSGISDGETISAESATRLTGFTFTFQRVNYQRRVQICNFDHPITAGLRSDLIFGGAASYGPVLYPTDGLTLGWAWSKFGGDDNGLALKTFDDYAALFTTAVPLPAEFWRGIARFAGAHVYCEENDVLMADAGIVALHTLKSGPRVLALPGPRRVTDLVAGRLVTERASEIRCEMRAPETKVFLLEE